MQLVERNIALLLAAGAAWAAPAAASAQSIFEPPAIHPIGAHSAIARVADLNRDGSPDVLTGGPGGGIFVGGTLRECFGNAKGGFGIPTNFGFFALDFDLVDLTGDGLLDLVAVETPGLAVHAGNGSGGFGPALSIVYVAGGGHFTLGDFDGNGTLDVVAAITTNPSLTVSPSIFSGNGAGALAFSGNLPGLGLFLATADVNADGKPDVVATYGESPPRLRVYLGSGLGGFSPLPELVLGGFGPAGPLAVGPIDAGGSLDVATRGSDALGVSAIRVLLGNGLGSFAAAPAADVPAPGFPFPVIADLNGDGLEDLGATSDFQGAFLYRLATVAGVFAAPVAVPIAGAPVSAALADFDASGRTDVLLATPGAESFAVLLGKAAPIPGTFAYGVGTPGCVGRQGIAASGAPAVGSTTFFLENTNVSPGSLGLFLVTDAPDSLGSDSAGIGVKLHVDPFASLTINYFDARADAGGVGIAHILIPNDPNLSGLIFFAQGLWPWKACKPSPLALSSSLGLLLTIP